MSKITKRLKEEYIGLCGNRANLLGTVLILGGIGFYFSWGKDKLFEDYTNVVSGAICQGVGLIQQLCTDFGAETKEQYNRAKDNIESYGKLDEAYFRKVLSHEYYCGRQGLYLATKEKGYTKEFRKAKKKYVTSKFSIPNF
jgi:hypothetical protein